MTVEILGTILTIVAGALGYFIKKVLKDISFAHSYIKILQKNDLRHDRNEERMLNKLLSVKKQAEIKGWIFEDVDWTLEERKK